MPLPGQLVSMTFEQQLERGYGQLLSHPHFRWLCAVLLIGEAHIVENDHSVKTAATNGRDCWYNREFCSKWSDAQLRFIILHETYHKLFRHLKVWRHLMEINAKVANQAMDYAINGRIKKLADAIHRETGKQFIQLFTKDEFSMCIDDKFDGWDEARIFYHLLDNPDEQSEQESMDSHDWEGAKELSDEEQKDLEQQLDEAIRQGEMIASRTGSPGIDEDVKELKKPQIRWEDETREFVKTCCTAREYGTWARPSRRYMANGIYMPSTYGEQLGPGIIAPDRSASCIRYLPHFMGEIAEICKTVKPESIQMMYWDTEVTGIETHDRHELDNLVYNTKPTGCGGTDVNCVSNYIRDHKLEPEFIIIFTDGHLFGGSGKWHHPVLWCVVDNKNFNPDTGKVIHINSTSFR